MFRILLCLAGLAALLSSSSIAAQDPHFSKFFANPIYLNPSYTGLGPGTTVTLNHHEQWQGIPDGKVAVSATGYRTVQATADRQMPCLFRSCKVRAGVALSVFHDAAGSVPLNTLGAGLSASFAYRLQCSSSDYTELRVGWQGSFMQRSLGNDYLIYSDQLNQYYGLMGDPSTMNLRTRYLNHNVGFMARFVKNTHNHLTTGISVANLLEPNQSLYDAPATDRLPRRYTLHAGGTLKRGEALYFSPQFRWDAQADGALHLLTGGLYIQTNKFYTGAFMQGNLRNYNASKFVPAGGRFNPGIPNLSLTAGLDLVKLTRKLDAWDGMGRRMIVGLTYDISFSSISNQTTWGGLELNFRMNFIGDRSRSCKNGTGGGGSIHPGEIRKCPVLEQK